MVIWLFGMINELKISDKYNEFGTETLHEIFPGKIIGKICIKSNLTLFVEEKSVI